MEGALTLTDGELMSAVRAGDLDKLGELFERHHQRLYGFFARMTGNLAASQDLVQEVFVRMLKYRHTYRPDGSFAAWMFTLARNAAADRRGRDRALVFDGAEAFDDLPAPGRPEVDRLMKAEAEQSLRRAILQLPPEKRELLLMARFRYLPYDEIAEQLGTTIGAVKVRVHRALKDLRVLLTPESPAEAAR